eukprot:TRINITY_DN6353_c0_g1_i1.p1 TRINITY_DN6353_c0_g1~~TRINITY_DN6353_c0_g1_i1.p1  ORF type:complete len:197 (+),score=41.37 TRINITY_DN6353_c0_g1_i1:64-654(+)
MRGVVQRVASASVTVGEKEVGKVGKGMCVLVGISNASTKGQIPWMVKKLLSLRIFEDENGKSWAKNVTDIEGEIMLVSQFTLCHVLKGAKPDFHNAMPGSGSEPFFDELVKSLRAAYKSDRVQTGSFGAHMQVHIQNDGPVTLVLDAPEIAEKPNKQQKPQKKKVEKPAEAEKEEEKEAATTTTPEAEEKVVKDAN